MILFMLVLGVMLGALLTHQVLSRALTASSRRAMEQLRSTLDGLETAHAMRVAMLEAEIALARQIDSAHGTRADIRGNAGGHIHGDTRRHPGEGGR